jgi:Fic family protein
MFGKKKAVKEPQKAYSHKGRPALNLERGNLEGMRKQICQTRKKEFTVSDIESALGINRHTAYYHITRLVSAGILNKTISKTEGKRGREMKYSVQ